MLCFIPQADILALSTSEESGLLFIETAELDGYGNIIAKFFNIVFFRVTIIYPSLKVTSKQFFQVFFYFMKVFNPLTSTKIFTIFEHLLIYFEDQSVTQRRMGHHAPRYPSCLSNVNAFSFFIYIYI